MESAKKIIKHIVVAIITWEAKLVLRKYNPKIIAVTGNVGKTSTKDAIFTVLSGTYHVRKSDKSFNSEIGVPLTILGRPNAWSNPLGWAKNFFEGLVLIITKADYPKWLVLEVGADRPGDISSTAKWIKPDIAVITRLPEVPVHVEFFPSAEAVRREKLSMLQYVKEGGIIIGNGDDSYIREAWSNAREDLKKLLFAIKKDGEIKLEDTGIAYDGTRAIGMKGVIHSSEGSVSFVIQGTLGQAQMYAAVAGAAVGIAAKVPLDQIAKQLNTHETPPGRMRLIEGRDKSILLDDTYNSSPSALEEAIKTLKNVKGARKIAALGDMLELGEFSVEAHKKAGEQIAGIANMIITVGVRARRIAETAREHGFQESMIMCFENSEAAAAFLLPQLHAGDVVLVKGSQSIRMEKIVAALMAHPEDKKKLLVRQDEEWQKR